VIRVHRLSLLDGARRARGVAVAIDVLRASSHIVTLFDRGAKEIWPVSTLDEAWALKRRHPDWILAGERHGLPPEGFELGNSPVDASRGDFSSRSVILTTSAGSRGMVAARKAAREVIVGCFLNAAAVAQWIRDSGTEEVSLLALGVGGEQPAPEDEGAAAYIAGLLAGDPPPIEPIFAEIRRHPEGRKFLDPAQPNYRPEDLAACLKIGISPTVPRIDGARLVASVAPGPV